MKKDYSKILITKELQERFTKAEKEENKYENDPVIIARYLVPQGSIYATSYEPRRSGFCGYLDFGHYNRGGGWCGIQEKMLCDRTFKECRLSDLLM